MNQNAKESIGLNMLRRLVTSVSDLGHQAVTLELSSHTVINTSGLAPTGRHPKVSIRLEANKALSALLHDFSATTRDEDHFGLKIHTSTV